MSAFASSNYTIKMPGTNLSEIRWGAEIQKGVHRVPCICCDILVCSPFKSAGLILSREVNTNPVCPGWNTKPSNKSEVFLNDFVHKWLLSSSFSGLPQPLQCSLARATESSCSLEPHCSIDNWLSKTYCAQVISASPGNLLFSNWLRLGAVWWGTMVACFCEPTRGQQQVLAGGNIVRAYPSMGPLLHIHHYNRDHLIPSPPIHTPRPTSQPFTW